MSTLPSLPIEKTEKPTEVEPLTPLTEVDILYIVLRHDHEMFTRDNSFENVQERLTFLHALLDQANKDGLTLQQSVHLLVSAYYGRHPRCNELQLPGCEEATSMTERDSGLIPPTSAMKEVVMPSFTTQQIENAYKKHRLTVKKGFWITHCSLWKEGNYSHTGDVREFYPKAAFMRFCNAVTKPEAPGLFRGIGGNFKEDMKTISIFNDATGRCARATLYRSRLLSGLL